MAASKIVLKTKQKLDLDNGKEHHFQFSIILLLTIRYVIQNSIKKENNKAKNLQKTCGAKVDQNSDMNR